MKHPLQPVYKDEKGALRFHENPIIRHLTYAAKRQNDLHRELFRVGFSDEDWQQYAQLLGYSLEEYGRLAYVSDLAYAEAVNSVVEAQTTVFPRGILSIGGADVLPVVEVRMDVKKVADVKDARIARLEHELRTLKAAVREQSNSLSVLASRD